MRKYTVIPNSNINWTWDSADTLDEAIEIAIEYFNELIEEDKDLISVDVFLNDEEGDPLTQYDFEYSYRGTSYVTK